MKIFNKFKYFFFVGMMIFITNINASELGYYKLDGDVMDSSSNGRNGTIVGTVTATEDRFGIANSAMYFNGQGHLEIKDFANFNYGKELSLSIWFRRDASNSAYMAIVNQGYYSAAPFEIRMGREAGGTALFANMTGTNGMTGLYSSSLVSLKKWEHIAVVYKEGILKYYLNGNLINVKNKDIGNFKRVNIPIFIGKHSSGVSGGEHFVGAIDDFRIFNNALSDDDVLAIYENTFGEMKLDILPKEEDSKVSAEGGRLNYTATIKNGTSGSSIHRWSVLTMPNGFDYSIHKDTMITVEGEKIFKRTYINIPEWFPAGKYKYTWYIAKPTASKPNILSDSFIFTKEE